MSAFSIAALQKRRELAEQMKDLSKNFEVCICYLISAHVGFDVKHTVNHYLFGFVAVIQRSMKDGGISLNFCAYHMVCRYVHALIILMK